MNQANLIFDSWKEELSQLLQYIRIKQSSLNYFYPKLFLFFFLLNFGCYWLGMILIFPGHVFGYPFFHYAKISFPVGFMGALFDSLSFYITLLIITQAIKAKAISHYIFHLSLDFLIAIIATFWVLFVFVVSGWLINKMEGKSYKTNSDGSIYVVKEKSQDDIQLKKRSEIYRARVEEAMQNPAKNWRNIFFGIIMGLSAMLPTCIHLSMFFKQLLYRTKS